MEDRGGWEEEDDYVSIICVECEKQKMMVWITFVE